ncbi:MAG: DUF4012 domain-containing protein [Acidimicrobiales bacterium]
MLATLGGAAPTGIAPVDVVYVGGAGASLALAGGRSRRATWLMSGVIALWATPDTVGRIVSIVALLLALAAVRHGRRRALGAAVGALLALVLGDLGSGPFHGSTVILAALAAGPMLFSGIRLMPRHWRRPAATAVSMSAAAAALATVVFTLSSALAFGDVSDGIRSADDGFDAAGDGEQTVAAASFDAARDSFERARTKVSGFWTLPARLVPIIGQQVRAVQVVAGEGVALTDTAADAARSVDPDTIRLVDGRLDLGTIEALQPVLDRTERALDRAHDRVSDARSPWLAGPLDDRIRQLLDELAAAEPSARTAAAAVRELPEFLGADGPVHWLVAITTPAEARGLGGLLGNWVLVQADDGQLTIVQSGRNEDINARLRERGVELEGPAQYLERWGRFSPNEFFQDVTLSPDLPMVAEVAADLFEKATDRTVDGVVVLDPYAVAALLELGGPVETDDITLTARTVVPYLLEGQYVDNEGDEAGRILTLAQLVDGAFAALTTGELPGPRAMADVLGPVVAEDRIGVWWGRGDHTSALIDAAGLDGRFPAPEADGTLRTDMVAVVHQNAGQNKLDTYLFRDVDYRLEIDDRSASGTITVTLRNELTDLSLPDAIIASNDQGYPLGTNVARVTIHTGLDFRAARLDGASVVADREIAFGHDALTLVVEIPPGGSRTIEIDVGGELDTSPYVLLLPQQPLVNDDSLTLSVTVDGSLLDLPASLTLGQDMVLRAPTD